MKNERIDLAFKRIFLKKFIKLKDDTMKKIIFIIISLIIFIFFFGCSTKLEIVNQTSYPLDLISWIDENGKTYWFGRDLVWDYVLDKYIYGLNPGSSDSQNVEPGRCPIYFWFASGGPEYHTYELVIVEKWKNTTFTLTNYTLIVAAGISANELKEMPFTIDKTSTEDARKRYQKSMNMYIR